jgi:hypothetical protein
MLPSTSNTPNHKKLTALLIGVLVLVLGFVVVIFFVTTQIGRRDIPAPDEEVFTPTVINEEYRQIKDADMDVFLKSDDPVARFLRASPETPVLK